MALTELEVTEESLDWDPTWPDADVIIPPGIPGRGAPSDNEWTRNPYPSMTTDVVKFLQQRGHTVEYTVNREEQSRISLRSRDCWMPVLIFAAEVARDVGVDVIASLVKDFLFRNIKPSDGRLHVRLGKRQPDGTVSVLEAHGDGDNVLEVIEKWDWTGAGQDGDADGH
ncbi:hypothetical protein [Candidatus Poriferisocius sp.]|uniref:hypothetical protein n=1 Tax=Candidatus Poriferisocius sp. TaxID=3101276 RepID=UPI003B02968C